MVPGNCRLITPQPPCQCVANGRPRRGCSGVLQRRPCHFELTRVLLGLERWFERPETPHEWDVSHVKPTPAPLGTGWHGRVSTPRARLEAKSDMGTSLFLRLWCRVPLTLFNLPLTEAFRGVLECQSQFCVDQVGGKSVCSLDLSQPLVVLGPHPWWWRGDLRFRTLRVTGMEWPLKMQLLRIGRHSRP